MKRLLLIVAFLAPTVWAQFFLYPPQVAPGEPYAITFYSDTKTALPPKVRFLSAIEGPATPLKVISFGPALDHSWGALFQVTVLIPLTAPEGSATVDWTLPGWTDSQQIQIIGSHYVAQLRPGNTPAALVQQYSSTRGFSENKLTSAAQPGDRIAFFGTGLGARPMDRTLQLSLAGVAVPVRWVERSADGIDRLEFMLPVDGAPLDCYVSLDLQVDRVPFAGGVISTSDAPGPCTHRLGLGAAELSELDNGGLVPVISLGGSVNVSSGASGFTGRDNFGVSMGGFSAQGVYSATGAVRARTPLPILPTCRPPMFFGPGATRLVYFDGGVRSPRTVILNGPKSARIPIVEITEDGLFLYSSRPTSPAPWDQFPPSQFAPGDWMVDLAADSAYPPVSVAFQIPRQLELTEPIQVPSPTQDYRARWNGSTFGPHDVVSVLFWSPDGETLECSTLAKTGELTVAAQNLSWIWNPLRPPPKWFSTAIPSATLTLELDGSPRTFQVQQPGLAKRFGTFRWRQTINVSLGKP